MNPYAAYKRQTTPAWTRIDMLLALYDGAIEAVEGALGALRQQDAARAQPLIVRAQLLVTGLASGVNVESGSLSQNLLRLFDFVLHGLRQGRVAPIEAGLGVLRTLRDGFEKIRPEAVRLERAGEIPPVDAVGMVQALA